MADSKTVNSMEDFIEKYGVRGVSLIVEEFVQAAPSFPREKELALALGTAMAELEIAVRTEQAKAEKVHPAQEMLREVLDELLAWAGADKRLPIPASMYRRALDLSRPKQDQVMRAGEG